MKFKVGQEVNYLGAIGTILAIESEKKKLYKVQFGHVVAIISETFLSAA